MRDDTIAIWIVFAVIIALGIAGIVCPLLRRYRHNKQIRREWETPLTPTVTEQHVYVLKKEYRSEMTGSKTPRHQEHFRLVVCADDGRIAQYDVDREIFHAINEHTRGTLAFVGNRVYGFSKD